MNTITITTDFGDQLASAQLHAVVASLGFDGKIIENHSVTPYSITEGAYAIELVSRYAPKQTVYLGVVDPGVGSKRKGIIIQTKNAWFVGPDNGLLYPAAKRDDIVSVWEIADAHFDNVSNTFHGRDIFIKAAVYLSQGKNPSDFGCQEINPADIIPLTFTQGQVLHIDDFGDIKVHWPHKLIIGEKLTIRKNNQEWSVPIVKTFSDVDPGLPLALLSSSGTLELAVNVKNAAHVFHVKVGDIIDIRALSPDGVKYTHSGKNNI